MPSRISPLISLPLDSGHHVQSLTDISLVFHRARRSVGATVSRTLIPATQAGVLYTSVGNYL